MKLTSCMFSIHKINGTISSLYSARKSKTHVSLVPRVLARREAGHEGEGSERSEVKKMSNDDFRKLLMKK